MRQIQNVYVQDFEVALPNLNHSLSTCKNTDENL